MGELEKIYSRNDPINELMIKLKTHSFYVHTPSSLFLYLMEVMSIRDILQDNFLFFLRIIAFYLVRNRQKKYMKLIFAFSRIWWNFKNSSLMLFISLHLEKNFEFEKGKNMFQQKLLKNRQRASEVTLLEWHNRLK